MFGIGATEFILILVIAFIFLGPDKFPGLAKSFGKSLRNFRETGTEIKKTIYEEVKNNDIDKVNIVKDLQSEIKKAKEELNPINNKFNETIDKVFNEEKT